MNSDTGAIQISPSGLDREIQSIYNLTINVTDRGEPELRVRSAYITYRMAIKLLKGELQLPSIVISFSTDFSVSV